jgi:hypothetical protein
MFAPLSQVGFVALSVLVLLNFIFVDLSVTSAWGKVELSSCTTANNSTVYAAQKLYLQPPLGMCHIANGLQVKPTDCQLWTASSFWNDFDTITGSNSYATGAAEKTMPGVYALLCVICFVCSLNTVVCILPFIKANWISMKIAQMITLGIQFLVFIMLIASLGAATTTPLTDAHDWEVYYLSGKQVSQLGTPKLNCKDSVYSAYVGTLWASFALVISLVLCVLSTFSETVRCADSSPAIDTSLTDALTKDPHSDAIPPNLSVNSGRDTFTSPIV